LRDGLRIHEREREDFYIAYDTLLRFSEVRLVSFT
jgi:hypothetical protein